MSKRTTKATLLLQRLLSGRFFVAPRHLSLRKKIMTLSRLELLGIPRNLIRVVFWGTSGVIVVLFILLCISYFILGNSYVLPRILACLPALMYLLAIALLISKERFTIVAWMLLLLYSVLATIILWFWSINAQIGILTLGFVVILAGTLLGARHIIPVTVGVIALLCLLQLANDLGVITPDITSLSKHSTFADVVSYGIIFAIFALITWLSRRQMEQALQRALAAEAAVEKEKKLLAVRLEEQTQRLRKVQIEEMQQLYRFAELGQLSTAVLHDLANHLTVLTLDIDDIGQRHHQSEAVAHAKESITYLDKMIGQVRRQLQDNNEYLEFNIPDAIEDTIATLLPKMTKNGITVTTAKHGRKSGFIVMGDPLRLTQVITIIATNALDAYTAMEMRPPDPSIEIDMSSTEKTVVITVTDYAGGISSFHRSTLFEPFKSTKEKGMGIGLFIAKKMVETHFKGTLSLNPRTDRTQFVIHIPLYRRRK